MNSEDQQDIAYRLAADLVVNAGDFVFDYCLQLTRFDQDVVREVLIGSLESGRWARKTIANVYIADQKLYLPAGTFFDFRKPITSWPNGDQFEVEILHRE